MAQLGPIAYVGSEDYTLYALDTVTLRLAWRFLVSAHPHQARSHRP